MSEFSEPDKPSLVLIEDLSNDPFGPTHLQILAKHLDHFRIHPTGHFPCSGKRFESIFSRLTLAGHSKLELGSHPHKTRICFNRSSKDLNKDKTWANLNCVEGRSCKVGQDPGTR